MTVLSDTLYRIVEQRRSVRSYSARKLDPAVIERIVYAATLAPCACNLQLHEFVYVDDEDLLEQLAQTATGKVRWAPACFVVLIDSRFTRHRQAYLQSAAASIQNLLLAAVSHGLATCWMAGFVNDGKVKELLDIPRHFEVGALISIGYPSDDEMPSRLYRSSVSEVLHRNVYRRKRPFLPTTPDIDKWQVEQVIEYRKRIAPVYGDRFHLAPFPDSIPLAALGFLLPHLPEPNSACNLDLLDAVTYDGSFARLIGEQPSWNVSSTLRQLVLEFRVEKLKDLGVIQRLLHDSLVLFGVRGCFALRP